MRVVTLHHDLSQLLGCLSPYGAADKLNPETWHPVSCGNLFGLGNEVRNEERHSRLTEFRLKLDAVADDRRRTDTSMPHSDDDAVGLFLDLSP